MFLIQCDEDNSFIISSENDTVCDKDTVRIGDTVTFFHKKETYHGQIMERSDDSGYLKRAMKKIQAKEKSDVKLIKSQTADESKPLGKRQSRKPRSFSPSDHANKRRKIKDNENRGKTKGKGKSKALKSESNREISSDTDSSTASNENSDKENVNNNRISRANRSSSSSAGNSSLEESKSRDRTISPPTKPISTKLKNQQVESNQKKAQHVDVHNEKIVLDSDDEEQLYGRDFVDEKMVHLQDEIYCRKSVYRMALGESSAATHVARKLLPGVIKPEVLVNCTMTGQSPRAQGKIRQEQKVIRMHDRAKHAIIDFSMRIAIDRKWESGNSKKDKIIKAMAQKIVELKTQKKKNEAAK